jgi:hypothetical protein
MILSDVGAGAVSVLQHKNRRQVCADVILGLHLNEGLRCRVGVGRE